MTKNNIKNFLDRFKSRAYLFFLPGEDNNYRARIFTGNFLAYLFLGAVFLKLGFAVFLYSFSNNPFYADITKTALVDLANVERAKHNLPPLVENQTLNQAAYLKALDMAQNGYFSHNSPKGVSPWHWFDQAGYDYKYAGENLAIGFLDSTEVQKAWTASPTHQANIVNNKYKEIGIAVLKANFDGSPATVVVQLFGSRPPKSQKPASVSKAPAPESLSKVAAGSQSSPAGQSNVLGAATEARADKDSPLFKAALFFAEKYFNIVQFIIYFSLIGVILLMVANYLLQADLEHADLLAKAIGFIAVMAVFALFDRSLVSILIPHTLQIN